MNISNIIKILLITLLQIDNSASQEINQDSWVKFQEFVKIHHKYYENIDDLTNKFHVFSSNLEYIQNHNSQHNNNYTLGINRFTDITNNDFKHHHIHNGFLQKGGSCLPFVSLKDQLPDAIDWRTKSAVTSVKNQGQCGSCWSFSAVGAIEGVWSIATEQLVNLSEQQLVDCSVKYGNMGCNGGLMDSAFQYVVDNGICGDNTYPYTGVRGSCESCDPVAKISGCIDVTPNNQIHLKEAVSITPVSIAIEADTKTFQMYSSGVITSYSCGTNLDHGVLIVGYGEENNIPYWLVKNSWGEDWGDNGYVKIERSNETNDSGICGISMSASYPFI